LFFLDDSGALCVSEFCKQYTTASASSSSKCLDLLLGISSKIDRHYSEAGQTSASNSTSMGISMYTFMPTKEEEERISKKKKI